MPRGIGIKLRVHRASGRLCKTIGVTLGRDGKPKKKLWYFDPGDKAAAVLRCADLKRQWLELQKSGKSFWEEAEGFVKCLDASNSMAGISTVPKPSTVEEAAKLYLSQIEERMHAGQVSQIHYDSQRKRLNKAIEPVRQIRLLLLGELELQAAVLKIAQRPEVKNRPGMKISACFARAALNSLRWFLIWCDETELVDWTKPSRFRAIFKTKPVLSAEEQRIELDGGREVDHFAVEEITKLWKNASDFQRCVILLGLNCGFCSAECADLRFAEVKGIDTDRPIIERYRQKTIKTAGRGSYARWHLWPETVQYLKINRAVANPDNIWLMTDDGRQLTDHNAIGQAWQRLVQRADVRPLSFKFVRKTAAHLVRNVLGYGAEVADMLLSHADAGMVKYYAGRDWDGKLREATERLRQHLAEILAKAD